MAHQTVQRYIHFLLILCSIATSPACQAQEATAVIDPAVARQYFDELRALSDKDGGHLWGARLYGPTMFADPATHQVVTNERDKEDKLQASKEVFVGVLPPDTPIANTSVDWAGVHWTMVMWPLPQNRRPRKQLMAHESFHRLQRQLGLTPLDSSNNHLDGRIGRTWLQLEWRALSKALATTGAARISAIADALYFRSLRRTLIPDAAKNENCLEANEGLAEYTGVKLSARYPQEANLVAAVALWQGPNRSPFVRSFAYVSGPAYGVLLDESGIPWRKRLKPDSDLGALLAQAYRIPATTNPDEKTAIARAQKYDGDEIIAHEKEREATQQKVIADATRRLIDGPVLVLPVMDRFNYGFDPDEVTAISDSLSVFDGNVHVTDSWGSLSVTNGALFVREKRGIVRVQVPAPANPTGSSIAGNGWKLELKPGWKMVAGQRKGDWTVRKE